MRAAKAKYELLGQDLVRLKNVLSNEPVGPKAEKRKKEITDLEIKVSDLSVYVLYPGKILYVFVCS